MTGGRTVLFSNNYPMTPARAGWRLGLYPAHHLYGTAVLEGAARRVVDVNREDGVAWGLLRRLGRRARWPGDPSQQLRVLLGWRRGAVLVAAEPASIAPLLRARGAGLPVPPIVVVVHERPGSAPAWRALRGADHVVAMAGLVRDELVAGGLDPARVTTLPWGPDLDFPGYRSTGSEFVLSTGKSRRDVPTLLRALERLEVDATIYGTPPDERAGARVTWRPTEVTRPKGAPGSYGHVLDDLQRAAVIAVPLATPTRPYGITELGDALALGKPIVMTRNPYIDVDLEAVGCGITVEVGDVDGWSRAIGELMADPARREEMGARGRRFAEQGFNAAAFGAGVQRILDRL